MEIAAAVVLYNPEMRFFDNINEYLSAVSKLYVIDNSDKYNAELIEKLKADSKVKYLNNRGNKGIAFALNRAVKNATHDSYEWMLTMDQDSSIESSQIQQMKDYIEKNADEMLALVSANYEHFESRVRKRSTGVSSHPLAITSGTMMNISICNRNGGFENKLFIDQVDYDYSLRLFLKGYRLIRMDDIYFQHHEGDKERRNGRVLWNYSPARYYYIARNNLYMKKKYGEKVTNYNIGTTEQYLEILDRVLHEKQGVKKAIAMACGILDCEISRFGKCKWKFI